MKPIILLIIILISFFSCNISKNDSNISESFDIRPISYNGNFQGEVLNKNQRKSSAKITISSDTNSYIFNNMETEITGDINWVDIQNKVIKLNGLDENYPNQFQVTSNSIIQLIDGSTLQDADGNRLFILTMQ